MSLTVQLAGLFFAGVLAGEELVVRYSVHPSLSTLDDTAQIRARQGLIKTLRTLVPLILLLSIVSSVLVLVAGRDEPGAELRWAGAAALLGFLLTFVGTVSLDRRVASWAPDAPPADWRATVRRWARLDVFRSTLAALAFLFFFAAGVVSISLGSF